MRALNFPSSLGSRSPAAHPDASRRLTRTGMSRLEAPHGLPYNPVGSRTQWDKYHARNSRAHRPRSGNNKGKASNILDSAVRLASK